MPKLPFGFAKPEDSPGFLLWQTTMVWQRQIKNALQPFNISHAQFVIMATLLWFGAHGYETNQIAIANWTKLDKMTVSKSLKKLVTLNYVNRMEHTTDTRAKKVTLTEKGRQLVNILVPLVESIDTSFFGKVSPDQQRSLTQILATLSRDA